MSLHNYASQTLGKAERRYCVTRRELLAVVTFTQHFRPYLLGRQFTLRTDHGSLIWLQSFKEPEGQLARWLEKLQEYQFTIVHRQGKKHANADALSHLPCTQCGRESHQTVEAAGNVLCLRSAPAAAESEMGSDATRDLWEAQLKYPGTALVLRAKKRDCKPPPDLTKPQSLKARKLLQQWDQMEVMGVYWPTNLNKKTRESFISGLSHLARQRKFCTSCMEDQWVHILVRPKLLESCKSASTGLDMWSISRSGAAHVSFVSKERIQLQKTRHHW